MATSRQCRQSSKFKLAIFWPCSCSQPCKICSLHLFCYTAIFICLGLLLQYIWIHALFIYLFTLVGHQFALYKFILKMSSLSWQWEQLIIGRESAEIRKWAIVNSETCAQQFVILHDCCRFSNTMRYYYGHFGHTNLWSSDVSTDHNYAEWLVTLN